MTRIARTKATSRSQPTASPPRRSTSWPRMAAGWRLDELGVGAMVDDNTSRFGTAFTVTVEAIGHGVTTGISAFDRATTIRLLCDEHAKPSDFAEPGHTFPLRAAVGGVLERAGQTEAIVDLCKLAG